MANNYASVDYIKEALPDAIPSTDSSYDNFIEALITRASRFIDRETGWDPGAFNRTSSDEETRYFTGSGGDKQWIDPFCAAPSAVAVSEDGLVGTATDFTSYATTDYFLYPYNSSDQGEPYYRLDLDTLNGAYSTWYRYPKSVKVTACFGYATATPSEIEQATIIQVARWFGRARQGYRDTGAIPELGQLRYTQALDPDVKEIIRQYRRTVV